MHLQDRSTFLLFHVTFKYQYAAKVQENMQNVPSWISFSSPFFFLWNISFFQGGYASFVIRVALKFPSDAHFTLKFINLLLWTNFV